MSDCSNYPFYIQTSTFIACSAEEIFAISVLISPKSLKNEILSAKFERSLKQTLHVSCKSETLHSSSWNVKSSKMEWDVKLWNMKEDRALVPIGIISSKLSVWQTSSRGMFVRNVTPNTLTTFVTIGCNWIF